MAVEYQWTTRIGVLRLRQEREGLWAAYIVGRRWLADYRDPDHLADTLASADVPFPAELGVAGNSSSLGLSDNLADWERVVVK